MRIEVYEVICHFCENVFERNEQQGLPKEESIVYEDENIYVMPDICPLNVGHMLIITKRHYQGYASADKDSVESVNRFLDYYKRRIGYRNFTIFEHGAVVQYCAGASIDHAHIHLVPFELPMNAILDLHYTDFSRRSLDELAEFGEKRQPYIYYKLGNETKGYAYPVGMIASQYLRDVANQLMKRKPDYNWKAVYRQADAYVEFHKTLAWWRSLDYPIPFKWKKKLILEKFGLSGYREIVEETNRFRADEGQLVQMLLKKELENSEGKYFRLVLVPWEHQYKLTNYVVSNGQDLDGVEEFFRQHGGYREIWYFVGQKKSDERDFSGRIAYSWLGRNSMEFIEMVSGDNPREIEKYTLKNKSSDYLRLSKKDGEHVYHVEEIHVGLQRRSFGEWWDCFQLVEKELKRYRDKLRSFRNMVRQYGISSLSLDFKVSQGVFQMIDWDTSNDERILKNEDV